MVVIQCNDGTILFVPEGEHQVERVVTEMAIAFDEHGGVLAAWRINDLCRRPEQIDLQDIPF